MKSGAHVTIYSSSAYPADPTVNQAAADFVDSLVHGSEISKVKIFFAPPAEVGALCEATEVDGCYFSSTGDLITTGEDTPWSTVEEVLAHEYGHHVATNRLNDPWPAVVYGTKRWATYEGVCQKAASGVAFPGDEGEHYFQNPGEAFAESYLHLNELKLGLPETPWGYDPMFTPDAGALAAIEQDVLQPWKKGPIKYLRGRFTRRGQHRIFTFKTPLDGGFAAEMKGPRGSSLKLIGPVEVKRYSAGLSAGLVCGRRTVSARITAGGPVSSRRRRSPRRRSQDRATEIGSVPFHSRHAHSPGDPPHLLPDHGSGHGRFGDVPRHAARSDRGRSDPGRIRRSALDSAA